MSHHYNLDRAQEISEISGTSMGSKLAPSFASLFCGHFEHDIVFNGDRNPHLTNISSWKRYIDDIFLIWRGSADELEHFRDFLNTNNYNLKFTMEYSSNRISFLDILVQKDSDKLFTNLYRKATDRNSILHGHSFHPVPLKKSLPISQFNRVRRICSMDSDYQEQSNDLVKRFQQRQYKDEWITPARERFSRVSQMECLEKRKTTKKVDNCVNCVIQYSPLSHDLKRIVNKHWHIIKSDPHLQVLSEPPRFVLKRPPNLNNMLVRADLPQVTQSNFLQNAPPGNYRCGHCAQCSFTQKSKTFSHPRTGKTYHIKSVISCNTKNVIYMLKCPCGLAYIGKTTRPLKQRISEHRSSIRNNDRKSPVAVHFHQAHHNVSALRYTGIEQVQLPRRGGDIDNILLRREAFWIYSLDTLSPNGLNEDFDLRPFL